MSPKLSAAAAKLKKVAKNTIINKPAVVLRKKTTLPSDADLPLPTVPSERDVYGDQDPPAECLTCEQKTGQIDRDSDPGFPKWLRWVKARSVMIGKSMMKVAYGKECYACGYVRLRLFGNVAQPLMIQQSKENTETDAKMWANRKKIVNGEKLMGGPSSVETATSKEDYADRFKSGSFEPIFEFALARRLRYDADAEDGGEKELSQLIAARYPSYVVGYDASKTLGVRITDQTGGGYRWKEGARENTSFTVVESHEHEAEGAMNYERMQEDEALTAMERVEVAADGTERNDNGDRSIVDGDSDRDCSDVQSQVPRSVDLKVGAGQASGSTAGARERAARSDQRSRLGSQLKAKASSSAAISVAGDCEDSENDEEEDGKSPAKRMTKRERCLVEASVAYEKLSKEFSADAHVGKFKQEKTVASKSITLRKWGRACGRFEGEDEQLRLLSQAHFNLADMIEVRQTMAGGSVQGLLACGDIGAKPR
jgi:hypothetical protein